MEWYVAKGAVLSSIGNFIEAKQCLDNAIPSLKDQNKELYIEASVHKARVLRNFMSFEDSNKVLDELLTDISYLKPELLYAVAIEKIYNLCWNSQVNEAKDLIFKMIEICANNGQIKVKAWFERYLSVVSFLLGCMKDSVYYYERSLTIPIEEPQYLDMHSIDLYVAKAYQMLGEREKAIEMVEAELQRLKCKGRYEELWLGYLFAAEIHYQNTFIDRMNGGKKTFECTMQNFKLADEYAPLYRKTELQKKWAIMQRHIYGLMLNDGPVESIVNEIVENLHTVGDYFQTIALARLFSYYGAISDFKHAAMYARQSIEIGERSGMMMIPTMAYGMLARIAIASSDQNQAVILTRKFLRLCDDNGMIEYFRMRKAYDPVLEFARQNEIEPDFTREMMDFAGFKLKKAYITTLGEFAVYPYYNRNEPIKMRTKKERELFAFLLNAGREGATKEQIYEEIWYDSTSNNIKKLIGVNIAQLKKDLSVLGVVNSVESLGKHYSICKDEFVTDVDLFEEAAFELQENNSTDAIDTILALYKGEYLSEFESIWAVSKKIKYEKIYQKALKIYEANASDLVT